MAEFYKADKQDSFWGMWPRAYPSIPCGTNWAAWGDDVRSRDRGYQRAWLTSPRRRVTKKRDQFGLQQDYSAQYDYGHMRGAINSDANHSTPIHRLIVPFNFGDWPLDVYPMAAAEKLKLKGYHAGKYGFSLGIAARHAPMLSRAREHADWVIETCGPVKDVKGFEIEVFNEIARWEPVDPRNRYADMRAYAIDLGLTIGNDADVQAAYDEFQAEMTARFRAAGFTVPDFHSVHAYYDWRPNAQNPDASRITQWLWGWPEVVTKPVRFTEVGVGSNVKLSRNLAGEIVSRDAPWEARKLGCDLIARRPEMLYWHTLIPNEMFRNKWNIPGFMWGLHKPENALPLFPNTLPEHSGAYVLVPGMAEAIDDIFRTATH